MHIAPLAWLSAALLLTAMDAGAQETQGRAATEFDDQDAVYFNIPSQSLRNAIDAFSEISGVQVLYNAEIGAEHRSQAVVGRMTSEQAFQALLNGTGLIAAYSTAGAAVVSSPLREVEPADRTLAGTTESLDLDTLRVSGVEDRAFRGFAEAVLGDLRRALWRDSETSGGKYSVRVKLWVDAAGYIERARLEESTPDPGLNSAIVRVLRGLVLSSAPPNGMPQPLQVTITTERNSERGEG